jgi:hypothetical protein
MLDENGQPIDSQTAGGPGIEIADADGAAASPAAAPSPTGWATIANTVPSYKEKRVHLGDWQALGNSVAKAYPDHANLQIAIPEIFAAEGGMTPGPRGRVGGLEPRPGLDLSTPKAVARAQIAYLDDNLHTIGGSASLEQIDDPRSAAAFADTIFRSGRGAGARIVQQATNDVVENLPQEERDRLGLKFVATDGQMGPGTLAGFKELANNGYGEALRNSLAERRLADLRRENDDYNRRQKAAGRPLKPIDAGEPDRINHFR